MMADVSPIVHWTEMAGHPCGGTLTSPQQVIENVFAVLGSQWHGFNFKPERLIDAGNNVIGIGDYTGTYGTSKAMHARRARVAGRERQDCAL
jgi:uncharacterized protein